MTSETITIPVNVASSRAKLGDGVTLVRSPKHHNWCFAVTFKHPLMRKLIRTDQIAWIMDLAALDHVRGYEAGHLPIPTAIPVPTGNKMTAAYQTHEHAKVIVSALVNIMTENAAREGVSLKIERNDQC